MPSGYTAPIADGITFEEFAMACARNFGALIMMRDEPSDAPIPDQFKPSDWNRKKLAEARKELARIEAMTADQAESAARDAFVAAEEDRLASLEKRRDLRRKYEAMLAKAQAWEPPTPDHEGLHKFMCEQIRESIKWDCDEDYYEKPTKRLTGERWKAEQVASAMKDMAYHAKEDADEIERTNGRNAWVRALRESLSPPDRTRGQG